MYGILGYLDRNTEEKINDLREEMKNEGISEYAMRPHVTLATHNHLDVSNFIEQLEDYLKNESCIDLFFPSLGMFLKSGTLFLAPTKTPELTDFHNRYHQKFHQMVDPNSLYAPAKWVPHCTVTSHLEHGKLVQAFDWTAQRIEPFHAKIESLALLELDFDADFCTDARDIHQVLLKK